MKKGLFITFEGPDGSGKSTQIQFLRAFFQDKGIPVMMTREPGGTAIGEKIREVILDKANVEMTPMTEALLYAASRAQLVEQEIKPKLESGHAVICDRFVDSSIVYQGYGRKLGSAVEKINEFAVAGCTPDITFLLQVSPEEGKRRRKHREEDRIECESKEYHQSVYEAYLELASRYPERIVVLDGTMPVDELNKEILSHMERLLAE